MDMVYTNLLTYIIVLMTDVKLQIGAHVASWEQTDNEFFNISWTSHKKMVKDFLSFTTCLAHRISSDFFNAVKC